MKRADLLNRSLLRSMVAAIAAVGALVTATVLHPASTSTSPATATSASASAEAPAAPTVFFPSLASVAQGRPGLADGTRALTPLHSTTLRNRSAPCTDVRNRRLPWARQALYSSPGSEHTVAISLLRFNTGAGARALMSSARREVRCEDVAGPFHSYRATASASLQRPRRVAGARVVRTARSVVGNVGDGEQSDGTIHLTRRGRSVLVVEDLRRSGSSGEAAQTATGSTRTLARLAERSVWPPSR